MKVLENLKRTMESINSAKSVKTEEEDKFAAIKEKYSEIPADVLENLISDVTALCGAVKTEEVDEPEEIEETEEVTEPEEVEEVTEENEVSIIPSEGKPVEEPGKTNTLKEIHELDASEDDSTAEQTPQDFYTEEDDELIISEEDEDDELFDGYKDELDVVESDEEIEDVEEIEESDEEIEDVEEIEESDEEIEDVEESEEDLEEIEESFKNEANIGAKAAMANKFDGKGSYSSDVDALTEYLDQY